MVRRVEQARLRGRTSTPALYFRSTIAQQFLTTTTASAAAHARAARRAGRDRARHGDHAEHRAVDVPRRPAGQPEPATRRSIRGLDVLALRQLQRARSTSPDGGPAWRGRGDPHGKQVLRTARPGRVHADRGRARARSSWTATTSASGEGGFRVRSRRATCNLLTYSGDHPPIGAARSSVAETPRRIPKTSARHRTVLHCN